MMIATKWAVREWTAEPAGSVSRSLVSDGPALLGVMKSRREEIGAVNTSAPALHLAVSSACALSFRAAHHDPDVRTTLSRGVRF
jgi:hypothetical protein